MAIYSLDKKACKRSGAPVGQRCRYMLRLGKYKRSHNQDERLEAHFSGNMPAWAVDDPLIYWDATDSHERKNARLGDLYIVALPVELSPEQRLELARAYCEAECQSMPYTAAIHDGGGHNPHLHLLRSRSINDGYDRDPVLWFARAAAGNKKPEQGGARKYTGDKFNTVAERHKSIFETRIRWQDICNNYLEKAGLDIRIDCRTLAEIEETTVLDTTNPVPRPEIKRGKKHVGVHRGHWGTKQHKYNELNRRNEEAIRRLREYEASIAELEVMAAEYEAQAEKQERIEALHEKIAEQRRQFLAAASSHSSDSEEEQGAVPPAMETDDPEDEEDDCLRPGQ